MLGWPLSRGLGRWRSPERAIIPALPEQAPEGFAFWTDPEGEVWTDPEGAGWLVEIA
jgi:hypothetical protein